MKFLSSLITLLFVIFFITLLNSCEYAPTEEYIHEIEYIEPVTTLTLNDKIDNFIIYGTTTIYYDIDVENRMLYEVNIYIDDKFIETKKAKNGAFEISTEKYKEGDHILKFEIRSSAGTNSIADLNNAEIITKTLEWKFKVYLTAPAAVNIDSVYTEEGTLKIKWEKYTNFDFYSYRLSKKMTKESGPVMIFEFPNDTVTEFIDRNYIGGNVTYTLEVISQGGLTSPKSEARFIMETPKFRSVEFSEGQTAALEWSKCLLSNNFKAYHLYLSDGQRIYKDTVITDVNNNSMKMNIPFGAAFNVYLDTHGMDGNVYTYYYINNLFASRDIKQITLGSKFNASFSINTLNYSKDDNDFYFINFQNRINKLSGSDFSIVRISGLYNSGALKMSPDGKSLFSTHTNIVRNINRTDLLILKDLKTRSSFGDTLTLYDIDVADNEIVFLSLHDLNEQMRFVPHKGIVYDFKNNEVIAEIFAENDEYPNIKISPDAKHILYQNKLYSINGKNLNLIGDILSNSIFLNDNTSIVSIESNSIVVRSVGNLSVLSTYPLIDSGVLLNYDNISNNICLKNQETNTLYFYNVQTGKLVNKLIVYSNDLDYKFLNNTVITKNGFYYNINNN